MPSVFGSGAIARGSLFVRLRFGPRTPGVWVDPGRGRAFQAFPVKVAAGEIEAIMPADAPLGDAELIVRKQDDPAPPSGIRIVGIELWSVQPKPPRLGFGGGVDRAGRSLGAGELAGIHAAQPGQTIAMTGTGYGAADFLGQVAIGGKTVTRIRHAGRNRIDELPLRAARRYAEGCSSRCVCSRRPAS